VLVTGGEQAYCELYGQATSVWTRTGSFWRIQSNTATLLGSGKVLVAGGSHGPNWVASCLLYDSAVVTRVVTNTNDEGNGSLRDAMQFSGPGDTVTFDDAIFGAANSDAATVINLTYPLPSLDIGNVTIDAQDRRVTINGSAAGGADCLTITSNGNVIMGLTIVGFAGSAIVIQNAENNVIGGSRYSGAGPTAKACASATTALMAFVSPAQSPQAIW